MSGFFTTGSDTAKVSIRLVHDVPGSAGSSFYWDSISLARDTAVAWERWERELTSTTDYSEGSNHDPYRDLHLTATFYRNATCADPPAFQEDGYWDGTPTNNPKSFKIRAALPQGDWCWKTACATSAPPGVTTANCAGDLGLNQTGTIKVTPYVGTNKLYKLGLPTTKPSASFLVYGDNITTFAWTADTAWSAPMNFALPPLGSPPSSDLWKNYVADRAGKGFTVLLVAPATQYVNAPASRPTPPTSGFAGFLAGSGCNPTNYKVVPNECSYLDPIYWRKLDSMVKDANDAGIVVLVAGVIDPTDRGGPGTLLTPLQKYPRKEATEAFARQVAARLAGSFVFFSPGFDDKVDELLDDGVTRVRAAMEAVGTALRGPGGAAPRHLVGNQLAGGADLTNYDLFHQSDWLRFELYQSGHKGNRGTPCDYDGPEYARAVCRARELTLRFRCQSAASSVKDCPTSLPAGDPKPAVNSEGAYENFEPVGGPDPDNREGERHTAYASALSGSFGYTIGVQGISDWSNPAIFSDSYLSNKSQADNDLGRLGGLFKGLPWTNLEPRNNLIANNPAVNTATTSPNTTGSDPTRAANERKRMILAGNSSYALVYVPGVASGSRPEVQIKTSLVTNALPEMRCGCWNKDWVDPRTFTIGAQGRLAVCSAGTSAITIRSKDTLFCPPSASSCDWVLRLVKPGTPCPAIASSASSATAADKSAPSGLEVWTEVAEAPTTSAVLAQLNDSDGAPVGDPIVVSAEGTSFQKLPLAVRDVDGNFFVSWESESPVTGFDEILARRYDPLGNPLGETFAVSQPAEGQQAEPSADVDLAGNVAVTWTRHGLEGEPEAIEVALYDRNGAPIGDTIALPPIPGDQTALWLESADTSAAAPAELDSALGGALAQQAEPVHEAGRSLVLADGPGFWVAWTVMNRDGEQGDVYAQRVLESGVLSGRSLRVNKTQAGVRRLGALRPAGGGSFRVVWEGLGARGRGRGLRERSYDSNGHPLGDEAPANSLE